MRLARLALYSLLSTKIDSILTSLFGLKSNKSLRFIRIRLLNVKSPAGGLPTSAWEDKIRHCNLLSDQRTIIRINILAFIITLILIVNIIIIITIAKKRKGGAEQEAAAAVLSIPHCTAQCSLLLSTRMLR